MNHSQQVRSEFPAAQLKTSEPHLSRVRRGGGGVVSVHVTMDVLVNQIFWERKTCRFNERTVHTKRHHKRLGQFYWSLPEGKLILLAHGHTWSPNCMKGSREAFYYISYSRTSDFESKNIKNHVELFFTQPGVQQECRSTSKISPHNGWLVIDWSGSTGCEVWTIISSSCVGREIYYQIPGLQQMTE